MSSDSSMLRACAAAVQCTGKPYAKRLSDFLWDLADRLEEEPEQFDLFDLFELFEEES